jgi:hypothetical protein
MGRAESSSPRVLPPPLTVPVVETRMCKPQAHRFASGSTNTASGGDVSTSGSPSEQLDASRCWPPGALRAHTHLQRDARAVLTGTYTPECRMHMNELFSAGRITLFKLEHILMNENWHCRL